MMIARLRAWLGVLCVALLTIGPVQATGVLTLPQFAVDRTVSPWKLYHYGNTPSVKGLVGTIDPFSGVWTPWDKISSLAALQAIAAIPALAGTTVLRTGYSFNGDGGAASYTFSTTPCALNSGAGDGGLQAAPTSGTGCWNASLTDADVRIWGAVSGASDATARTQVALNSGVRSLSVPFGVLNVSALSVPAGVRLHGLQRNNSIINATTTTGDFITLGDGAQLDSLGLTASANRTSGCTVKTAANGTLVSNNIFKNYYIAFCNIGAAFNNLSINSVLQDNLGFLPSVGAGTGFAYYEDYGGAIFRNNQVSGPATGQQPDFSIRIGGGDTIIISDSNITLHGTMLLSPPVNESVFSPKFSNSLFDSAKTTSSGAAPSCTLHPTGNGNIFEATFENVWCGLSSADGLLAYADGGGVIDGLHFTNSQFEGNGANGLHIAQGVTNWTVEGGQAAGNANSGAYVSAASLHWSIRGFMARPNGTRGPNGSYGINIASGNDFFDVSGNDVSGNTGGSIFDGSIGNNSTVVNNRGYNPLGANVLTPGASPWSIANRHYPTGYVFQGGTVSNVSLGGVTWCTSTTTQCVVHRAANQNLTVTYSAAPTTAVENME